MRMTFFLRFGLSCLWLAMCAMIAHTEDEIPGFKPAPVRPTVEATVIVEDQVMLDECDPDKICIEGNLFNSGARTAYRLKLRVRWAAENTRNHAPGF